MKTKHSLAVAAILLSIFASNALGVLRGKKENPEITITPIVTQSIICHVSRWKWRGTIGLNMIAKTPKTQTQATRFLSCAVKAEYTKAAQQCVETIRVFPSDSENEHHGCDYPSDVKTKGALHSAKID